VVEEHSFMIKHVICGPDANPYSRAIGKLVGSRLRARRIKLGFSIDRVAEVLQAAPNVYEDYESGRAQVPALLLARLSGLFAVPVYWFFQDVASHHDEDGQAEACQDA